MPAVEVRPAQLSDLNAIQTFNPSFQTPYVWQMERFMDEGQWSIHFRELRLPRPVNVEYPRSADYMQPDWISSSTILVAILNGNQVGFLRMRPHLTPKTAWITDLVVREDVRRQGIASVLSIAAQDWAVKHDYRRSILEMQSKNYPAIRMALKLGYEFCGYNDHYYANQDIALFFARFLR
jgi:ribosomal protein S18 acetylase RimI-like enzyme